MMRRVFGRAEAVEGRRRGGRGGVHALDIGATEARPCPPPPPPLYGARGGTSKTPKGRKGGEGPNLPIHSKAPTRVGAHRLWREAEMGSTLSTKQHRMCHH